MLSSLGYPRPVPGGGFEPPKAKPADLQSAPFDRSGIPADRDCISGGDRLAILRPWPN